MTNYTKPPQGAELEALERQFDAMIAAEREATGAPRVDTWSQFNAPGIEVCQGQVTYHRGVSSTDHVPPAGSQPASLLETARRNGGPTYGGIREDDVVTLPNGMQTTIGGAMGSGWIVEVAEGQFMETAAGRAFFQGFEKPASTSAEAGGHETGRSPQGGSRPTQEDSTESDNDGTAPEPIERMSDEGERILAAHVTTVGARGANATIEVLYENKGEIPGAFVGHLAAKAGLSADEAQAQLSTVTTEFEKQAHNALGLSGDAAQEAVNWLWANRGMAMREAVGELVLNRSTKALTELGKVYARRR